MNAYKFHFPSLFIPFIAIYREGDKIRESERGREIERARERERKLGNQIKEEEKERG